MALTGPQLTQLMGHPQKCKVWVSVFQPLVVFMADVATGYNNEHNTVQVPYENPYGTPGDILDGMSLYVYSDTGELQGLIRTKSADSTYIYIAENDEVTFNDSQSLVVTDAMPPWTKFPTCDVSGDNPIFYKDYNVAYVDQNLKPPPVPILGPTLRCLILELSDTHLWKASSSYSPRAAGTISTYAWTFEGGTPGSSGASEVSVEYDTPGLYRTKLVITDDQGKTATAYRWIRVNGIIADADLVECSVQLSGSFREGGWKAEISGKTTLDLQEVPDQSLVAVSVLALDKFDVEFEFGGFDQCHQIYFCGYLNSDTVVVRPDTGWATFEAVTLDVIMTQMFNFDVFVQDVTGTPANWLEITALDSRLAGYHLLRWHSNIFELADVHLPAASARTAGIDMPQSNLFTQLRNMAQTVRMLQVGCSRYGSIHIEPDVQHLKWAQRQAIGKSHDMFKANYRADGVSWPRAHRREFAMIELAGVAWNGTDPTPLFSRSPGIVPVHEGNVKEINGLAVEDQDDINTLCGMVYAELINKNVGINFPMSGNWMPALDVYPQTMVELPYDFELRGVNYDGKWVVVRAITFNIQDGGSPAVHWTVDMLNDEWFGREFTYPTPDETYWQPIGPPPPSPPPPPAPPATTSKKVIIATHQYGIWVTSNFNDESPIWGHLNSGLSGDDLRPNWFARDPVNYKTQAYLATQEGLWRNDAIHSGGTWVLKASQATMKSWATSMSGESEIEWAMCTKMKPQVCMPGAVFFILNWEEPSPVNNHAIGLVYTTDRMQTFHLRPQIATVCGNEYVRDYAICQGWQRQATPYAMGVHQLVASPHTPWKVHIEFVIRSGSVYAEEAYYHWPDVRLWGPSKQAVWGYNPQTVTSGFSTIHVPFYGNKDEKRIYLAAGSLLGGEFHLRRFDDGIAPAVSLCDAFNGGVSIKPSFGTLTGISSLFGSYTWDKDRIWFASPVGGAESSTIGVSNDAGETWTQKTDAPLRAGSASGFPYNNQLFIVGLHPYYATAAPSRIAASYDGGTTWHDKTGDLCSKIDEYFEISNSQPGVICIAPEW